MIVVIIRLIWTTLLESQFAAAVTNGDTHTFMNHQAKVAMNYALRSESQLTLTTTQFSNIPMKHLKLSCQKHKYLIY